MVRYYGRARQRIGSVNTNQPALKQAGCPPTVGKQGLIIQHLGKRVNCNLKTCGLPMSGLRCRYGVADAIGRDKTFWDIQHSNNPAIKNYCHQVINKHNGTFCQWPQPHNRQNAGGVGNIWTSRRDHCEKTCSAGWQEAYMAEHDSAQLAAQLAAHDPFRLLNSEDGFVAEYIRFQPQLLPINDNPPGGDGPGAQKGLLPCIRLDVTDGKIGGIEGAKLDDFGVVISAQYTTDGGVQKISKHFSQAIGSSIRTDTSGQILGECGFNLQDSPLWSGGPGPPTTIIFWPVHVTRVSKFVDLYTLAGSLFFSGFAIGGQANLRHIKHWGPRWINARSYTLIGWGPTPQDLAILGNDFAYSYNLETLPSAPPAALALKGSMAKMFFWCLKLKDIGCHWHRDIGNILTSLTKDVTSLEKCFSGAAAAEGLADLPMNLTDPHNFLESWEVHNVTNMFSCFAWCSSFKAASLSKWNVSNCVNFQLMFFQCSQAWAWEIMGAQENGIRVWEPTAAAAAVRDASGGAAGQAAEASVIFGDMFGPPPAYSTKAQVQKAYLRYCDISNNGGVPAGQPPCPPCCWDTLGEKLWCDQMYNLCVCQRIDAGPPPIGNGFTGNPLGTSASVDPWPLNQDTNQTNGGFFFQSSDPPPSS